MLNRPIHDIFYCSENRFNNLKKIKSYDDRGEIIPLANGIVFQSVKHHIKISTQEIRSISQTKQSFPLITYAISNPLLLLSIILIDELLQADGQIFMVGFPLFLLSLFIPLARYNFLHWTYIEYVESDRSVRHAYFLAGKGSGKNTAQKNNKFLYGMLKEQWKATKARIHAISVWNDRQDRSKSYAQQATKTRLGHNQKERGPKSI